MRREPVNLSMIVNFDGLHDRYERHQRLLVLDGTKPAKVRITGADLSSGGLYRKLASPEYTLNLVPLIDLVAAPQSVGKLALSAPVNYADINVDLSSVAPGWYKMGLSGLAPGESVMTGFCRIIKSATAESVEYMPVVRGSHSRVGYEPNINVWSVVPSKYAPKAVPLTRVIDEANVPDRALKRSGLHCEFIVPVRWSDTHRPNVDKRGVMSTFDAQAYHWGQLHARMPTVPCLDGPRGVGTVTMATHIEVGEALVPVAGNPDWPQTASGLYRVANLYFTDPWRVGKIRTNGTVITMVGWRHKGGVMSHWEDGDVGYQGLLGGMELVGDWSAVPEDRRGFWEIWGIAWDRRRSGAANVGAPSPDPREKGLIPHPPGGGMVMFLPDTQHNRIVRCEFPHDTHFDYNRTKVTEFLTGLQDPWDCVGDDDGVLYVSERKAHRICAYSMDTGQLLRVVVQGQALATVNAVREVITSGTLDQRRAAPCVAPEGLYLQDGWLYFASKAQAQVRRVHLTTGELQVVRPIHIDQNSKFAKLALSDGTFGPRGSTFTWTWSNAQYGGPEMYGPPGADGSPAKWMPPFWEHQSGGTGNWATHSGYGTAGCAQFGRMATANMVEGVKLISKSMPGDKPMSAAALRGASDYYRRSLHLVHGPNGFGYYDLPLPWGLSADIDEFLLSQGHIMATPTADSYVGAGGAPIYGGIVGPDTTAPSWGAATLAGSAITSTTYTLAASAAATDAVGVTGYRYRINGGAWVEGAGYSFSVTGRTASTTDSCDMQARDAAGNWSTSISASVPLAAAGAGYANLTSITLQSTDEFSPSGGTQYPFTLILHASGGGNSALSFGSEYSAVTTGNLALSFDNELRWVVQQGVFPSSVGVRPKDQRNNTVAGWPTFESYHMGFVKSGELHLITERQYDQLMAWVDANVPQAHPTKRYLTGGSMGAWGTMTYGVRRAHMFAALFADRPRVRYSGAAPNRITLPGENPVSTVYNVGSDPVVSSIDGGGQSAAHLDCVAYLGNTANSAPWIGWNIGRNDGYAPFSDHVALVAAMRSAGRGFAFAWNDGDHGTGSIMAQITDSYSGLFELGVGYPVFSEHSLDADPAVDLAGGINIGLKFRNVVEAVGSWSCEVTHISSACTVKVKPRSPTYTGNPTPALVTIPAANTWVSVSF